MPSERSSFGAFLMRKMGLLFCTVLLVFSTFHQLFSTPRAIAQDKRSAIRACQKLSVETPRSEECDVEIAANQLQLEKPVEFVERRDGEAHSRLVTLPESAPQYMIAWQKRTWYFSDIPGVRPADNDWTLARRVSHYAMYYIYHMVVVDNAIWYLIGPGQWMHQEYVSILQLPKRPEEVSGPWVAIDLTQQTLVGMVDDQPKFATLISSGYWIETSQGLYQVYARTLSMTMTGPPGADPPEYVLAYTPWVMFFNENEALHGAYYHNNFGLKRSHGCINLVPGDAEFVWLFFEQTIDQWHPSREETFFVDNPEAAPWVLIYESPATPEMTIW